MKSLPDRRRLRRGAVLWILLTTGLIAGFDLIAPDETGWRIPREAAARDPRIDPRDRSDVFEHIILTWKDNPATTQAVTWQSSKFEKKAIAEIAPSTPSPDFQRNARQLIAETSHLKTDSGVFYYHRVNFQDLNPGTLYAYRVGNGDVWSEWFQFRTAADGPAPFSFLYFGDAQNHIRSLWSRTIRAAILKVPEARFMIHAGDLVDRNNNADEWNEWFAAGGWIFAMVPSLPVAGNHEYHLLGGSAQRMLSKFWRPQFTLPDGMVSGLEETAYALDYQGVRIIVLDSNQKLEQQGRWLENLLEDNPNQWTIAAFHHPVYSAIRGRDNPEVRNLWQPLFDRYRVDLVLQGHDHIYARGRGVGPDNRPALGGPVYVTSVSGPKMYRLDRRGWIDRAGENIQLFQSVSISGSTLSCRALTVTGDVFDAFDLVRNQNGANDLRDAFDDN